MSILPIFEKKSYADLSGALRAFWLALAALAAIVILSVIFANALRLGEAGRMLDGLYPADPAVWSGFTT